jgi:sugar O-acyltransferase (sialic acid O-acetyltransferase NeuD family)
MSKLLILGAGGHGKVVLDVAKITGKWDLISFLDDRDGLKEVMEIPVIGKLEDYKSFREDYNYAFVAIGNNELRLEWLEKLSKEGFIIPKIIHPFSSLSKNVEVGMGTIIMPGVVLNTCAKVGNGCILNTNCSIDHDCILGDAVHLSPGVSIGGTVIVKSKVWLGIGSSISNNIVIGNNSIVAAGAVVIKDVPDNVIVAGIPAKVIKTNK